MHHNTNKNWINSTITLLLVQSFILCYFCRYILQRLANAVESEHWIMSNDNELYNRLVWTAYGGYKPLLFRALVYTGNVLCTTAKNRVYIKEHSGIRRFTMAPDDIG